jgi:vacuolar protein sorting-associated protein 35
MSNPAPPEDQARLLEDALVAVRQQTALMRKCLDTPGKLMDALKCWCVLPTHSWDEGHLGAAHRA